MKRNFLSLDEEERKEALEAISKKRILFILQAIIINNSRENSNEMLNM